MSDVWKSFCLLSGSTHCGQAQLSRRKRVSKVRGSPSMLTAMCLAGLASNWPSLAASWTRCVWRGAGADGGDAGAGGAGGAGGGDGAGLAGSGLACAELAIDVLPQKELRKFRSWMRGRALQLDVSARNASRRTVRAAHLVVPRRFRDMLSLVTWARGMRRFFNLAIPCPRSVLPALFLHLLPIYLTRRRPSP